MLTRPDRWGRNAITACGAQIETTSGRPRYAQGQVSDLVRHSLFFPICAVVQGRNAGRKGSLAAPERPSPMQWRSDIERRCYQRTECINAVREQ